MAYKDTASFIRERKRNTRSLDEQVQIAHAMWDDNINPSSDGLKRKEVEQKLGLALDYKPKTSLGHLEEIGIFEEFVKGPRKLVIAEWMDNGDGEVVLGRVDEAAEEGLEALANHIEASSSGDGVAAATDGSGHTLRAVVSSKLDLVPDTVETYLRTTTRPVDVLNQVVKAIKAEDSLDVADDYGEIVFINTAYRYRLTHTAVGLYER